MDLGRRGFNPGKILLENLGINQLESWWEEKEKELISHVRWVLFTNLFWSRLDGLEHIEWYGCSWAKCYQDLILCSLGYQGTCLSSTALGQTKITFVFSSEECNSTNFTSYVFLVFFWRTKFTRRPGAGQSLPQHLAWVYPKWGRAQVQQCQMSIGAWHWDRLIAAASWFEIPDLVSLTLMECQCQGLCNGFCFLQGWAVCFDKSMLNHLNLRVQPYLST